MSRHRKIAARWAALALVAVPTAAHADGLEFAGAGARGTMRGGAYLVGSDDAMALLYNPANLATVPTMQLHASLGLLFYSSCFDRDGTYGYSPEGRNRTGQNGDFETDPLGTGAVADQGETALTDALGNTLSATDMRDFATPEVCNSHRVNVIPELAYSFRIGDRVGIGLGLVAPTAPGALEFGETINGRQGMVRSNGMVLPSPGRYMLVGQSALVAFPTVGVGIEVADRVRVGASLGWGFGTIKFRTMAAPYYAEDIAVDIFSTVNVSDYFVPRASVGISGGPFTGVSFGAQFTYVGDLDAHGTIHAETLYFASQATRAMYRTDQRVPVNLNSSLPWSASAGVRYADILEDVTLPEGAVGDSLDTERWNLEFNVGYTLSSRVRAFDVALEEIPLPAGYDPNLSPSDPANQALYPCSPGDITDGTAPACVNLTPGIPATVPLRFPSGVRHNWKDQYTFRLGADFNVVRSRLGVSAGLSYDSNGQEHGYEQLDFQPYRRVGTHLGMRVRINRWDVSLAYAHHFNQTRTPRYLDACPVDVASGLVTVANDANGDGDAADVGDTQASCLADDLEGDYPATADDDWGLHPLAAAGLFASDVVNTGRFRSSLDVIQVGATYHFR